MRPRDLFRESWAALRGSRSRTLLTAMGVTVGALALALILSLSLGLSTVVDDLVSGESQLRQVVVSPGFGGRLRRGDVPEVEGEMSEEKRSRLKRALSKRSRGGPSMQLRRFLIDAATEHELSDLPQVEEARPFLQERFEIELEGGEPTAGEAPRSVLALGVPAEHAYYPRRVLAGRWFESDTEQGVVVHELLLYRMGFIDDAAGAEVVGRKLKLTARARKGGGGFAELAMSAGLGPRRDAGAILYTVELPIVGVVKERYGDEPSSVVEEAWAMQTDLFLPISFMREHWDKRPGREGLAALMLVARSLDEVEPIEAAARERGLQARSVREVVARVKRTLNMATLVAGFLAGIAVFVSALGIVNTMVMSVLERTREIGLLKALGARSGDVARLFLVEGGLLGLAGGLLGIALALGLGQIGNEFGRWKIEETFQWPFSGTLFPFPPWLIAGTVAFAVVTSLIASVIPAVRAARIDPVRALRHE